MDFIIYAFFFLGVRCVSVRFHATLLRDLLPFSAALEVTQLLSYI
jgi:hypothetical protein